MKTKNIPTKAVIYCRVSSAKQVTEGHGLSSQETRCREYARHKQYDVMESFLEEGISGGLLDRPKMQAMLKFLKAHKSESCVVIIDDISRLARGIETHIRLRAAIAGAGGKLESPSIEFGEDSDSRLVEHLLASVAAHQREKNAEQSKNRMRARAMNGYWVFHPPVGYRFADKPGHGKIMVPDEITGPIITEALEGFACGRFATQGEFKLFLDSFPHFPNTSKKGGVSFQTVRDILERPIYAGYLDIPKWGITLQPGKHSPLVSYETYVKVQQRLKQETRIPNRKDIHLDFPLRGYVTCGCCGKPMTSCWSRGDGGRYAYYLCQGQSDGVKCSQYGKSIRADKMEREFEKLLGELRPRPELFFMIKEIFVDLWEEQRASAGRENDEIRVRLSAIERKTEQFLERVVETDSREMIVNYENMIRKLAQEKVELKEKISQCGRPLKSFDETFRTSMEFFANPQKLWHSDDIEHKRSVLRLVFADKLAYDRNEGFRTPAKALPFTLLEGFSTPQSDVVRVEGIEPPLLTEQEPKSCASTNSATPANQRGYSYQQRFSQALYLLLQTMPNTAMLQR